MLVYKTHDYPGLKAGYYIAGKMSITSGEGSIVITTGPDFTGKILAVHLDLINDGALLRNVASIGTPTYSATDKTVTIPVYVSTVPEELSADLSVINADIVAALRTIVTNAPADVANLLNEISSAATTIENGATTGAVEVALDAFTGEAYFTVLFSQNALPANTNTQNILTDNPS